MRIIHRIRQCVSATVLAMAAFFCLALAQTGQAQLDEVVRYVDIDKSCSASCNGMGSCGNGESWSTAYKFLQDALTEANDPVAGADITQIWVADGTYYPDESAACPSGTGSRTATFTFGRPGLRIMGGFDGTEIDMNQRDPFTNVTILSGDIDEDNTLDNDNSYHVVTALDAFPTAILDGFTITMGYAVDAPHPPTISSIMPHVSEGAGGGLISYYFDPTGMGSFPPADPTILRCKFHTNIAQFGGGMFITAAEQGGPEVYNCVFYDNEAEEGGAVYFAGGQGDRSKFEDCQLFAKSFDVNVRAVICCDDPNVAIDFDDTGCIINSSSHGPRFIQCRIVRESQPELLTDRELKAELTNGD